MAWGTRFSRTSCKRRAWASSCPITSLNFTVPKSLLWAVASCLSGSSHLFAKLVKNSWIMLCPADYLSFPGQALSLKKVVCCHKQSCFFCFNNELSECNESDCRNQWTQAFTESNEFGKAMWHVHVGRFVIFVERLRSLSCLVYSLHLLDSLFNNIALQWKISHFQAKHAIRCSAPFRFRHHLTYGRWISISMPLPAKPVDFTRQSPCLCPPISMLLKGGFGVFANALDFR